MTIEMKRIFLTLAILMTFVSAYAQEEAIQKAVEPSRNSLSIGTSIISMSGFGNNQAIGPLFSMKYSSVFGKNGNSRTNVGVMTNFNNALNLLRLISTIVIISIITPYLIIV